MNKLMKTFMMVVSAVALLGLAGCGNSPETVVKNAVASAKALDFEGAAKYCTGDVEEMAKALATELAEAKKKDAATYEKELAKIKKEIAKSGEIEIGKAVIDGENAKVEIKPSGEKEKISVLLVKVDGQWKIKTFEPVK